MTSTNDLRTRLGLVVVHLTAGGATEAAATIQEAVADLDERDELLQAFAKRLEAQAATTWGLDADECELLERLRNLLTNPTPKE